MTPESHGDNYYYHLLMLYLPWHQETKDLLGEYSTAQEALLAGTNFSSSMLSMAHLWMKCSKP